MDIKLTFRQVFWLENFNLIYSKRVYSTSPPFIHLVRAGSSWQSETLPPQENETPHSAEAGSTCSKTSGFFATGIVRSAAVRFRVPKQQVVRPLLSLWNNDPGQPAAAQCACRFSRSLICKVRRCSRGTKKKFKKGRKVWVCVRRELVGEIPSSFPLTLHSSG